MRNNIRRFAKASCTLDGIYWYIAKRSGIKENLFWLLYALNDNELHTQKQICEDWQFPKTTINTLIKECEAAGYVELNPVPGKKRELYISLTDMGKEYAQRSLKAIAELEERAQNEVLRTCSPGFTEEYIRFVDAFSKMTEDYFSSDREG